MNPIYGRMLWEIAKQSMDVIEREPLPIFRRRTGLGTAAAWLSGVGMGVGLMYLLDPNRGQERREKLRDKAEKAGHALEQAVEEDLQLISAGRFRRGIDLHKTIEVNAPVEEVFRMWSHFENFPMFMERIREVTLGEHGQSHWKVVGPGGLPVEWDAELTAMVPNELVAWRTLPDQPVEHTGNVSFKPSPTGGTTLDIRMSYHPPAGVIGHAVAALLDADPKAAMDKDLQRFKQLLEEGRADFDRDVGEVQGAVPQGQGAAQDVERTAKQPAR
jgi:uncharacterized membrane protein